MAKASKPKTNKGKSSKQASNLFHNILAASVSGNPKPTRFKKDKPKNK